MNLASYLTDTFNYNDYTNKKLLLKINLINKKDECIKLFSHLINSQYKWMARIIRDPRAKEMSWWEPVYNFNELEYEWTKSLHPWMTYIAAKTEEELSSEV